MSTTGLLLHLVAHLSSLLRAPSSLARVLTVPAEEKEAEALELSLPPKTHLWTYFSI